MAKWADYVISEANYDKNHKITKLKQHQDDGKNIGTGEIVNRTVVIHNIKKGQSYVTAFNGLSSMRKGEPIRVHLVFNDFFLRIDKNKVGLDNLGQIPEIS